MIASTIIRVEVDPSANASINFSCVCTRTMCPYREWQKWFVDISTDKYELEFAIELTLSMNFGLYPVTCKEADGSSHVARLCEKHSIILGARLEWCSIERNKRLCYELLTFKNMDSCRHKFISP